MLLALLSAIWQLLLLYTWCCVLRELWLLVLLSVRVERFSVAQQQQLLFAAVPSLQTGFRLEGYSCCEAQ